MGRGTVRRACAPDFLDPIQNTRQCGRYCSDRTSICGTTVLNTVGDSFLTWLRISIVVMLLGAELDAEIGRKNGRKKRGGRLILRITSEVPLSVVRANCSGASKPGTRSSYRTCKRRSNNPSLKRPDFPVAPEQKSGSRYHFALGRQRVGDEGRGALRACSLRGSDRGVEPSRCGAPVWNRPSHGRQDDEVHGADPPPMNWSALRYVFGSQEDQNAEQASQAGRDRGEAAPG
jgi:hypothetical protein